MSLGTGFLRVSATTAEAALPVVGAKVTISQNERTLYTLMTDADGNTEAVAITAPDKELSLDPEFDGVPYAYCDVDVSAEGYVEEIFHNVEIFDANTTILPVNMTPEAAIVEIADPEEYGKIISSNTLQETYLPEHGLLMAEERHQEYGIDPLALSSVVIPLYVTVHLGSPTSNASNVTVPFRDYIKNVASHEFYPTWPDAALEANIY